MEHKTYITNRRAKIQGIGGYVNLPYGTEVSVEGRFLYYQGKSICSVTSNNAHTYFLRMTMGMEHNAGAL